MKKYCGHATTRLTVIKSPKRNVSHCQNIPPAPNCKMLHPDDNVPIRPG